MTLEAPSATAQRILTCPGCGEAMHSADEEAVAPPVLPAAPATKRILRAAPLEEPLVAPAPVVAGLSLDSLLDNDSPKDPASVKKARAKVDKARKEREADEVWKMSLAALGGGILSFGLFWLPFVGPATGMIATGIGVATLMRASRRRDLSIRVATSGTFIGFAAMFLGGYITIRSVLNSNKPDDGTDVAQVTAKANPAALPGDDDAASKPDKSDSAHPAGDSAKSSKGGTSSVANGAAAKSNNNSSVHAAADASAAKSGTQRNAVGANNNGNASPSQPKSPGNGAKSTSAAKTPGGASASGGTPPKNGAKSPAGGTAGTKTAGANDKKNKTPDKPKGLVFQGEPGDNTPAPSDTGDTGTGNSGAGNKIEGKEPAAPATTEIRWAAVEKGEPQGRGDIKVRVDRVLLGKVVFETKDPTKLLGSSITESTDSYLVIWLSIRNQEEAGSVEYKTWFDNDSATLADDQGHAAERANFRGKLIVGVQPAGSIRAGQAGQDAIVFNPPAGNYQYLRLTLPGASLGQKEDFHFQIPHDMIKAAPAANEILGEP